MHIKQANILFAVNEISVVECFFVNFGPSNGEYSVGILILILF